MTAATVSRLSTITVDAGTPKPVDLLKSWPPDVPMVTITTVGGAPIVDRDNYISGTMTINGATPYSGTMTIKGRGNSTWPLPKKPYKVKLGTAAGLLGMPSNTTWVLLANYKDSVGLRTAVAFEAGQRAAGLAWTPHGRFVELTLNGVFLGAYQLVEQPEVKANKVNITKASGSSGLSTTGAFLAEIDARYVEESAPGFTTTKGVPVAFDDPDGTNAAQAAAFQAGVQAFENALFGSSWTSSTTGYPKYIDVNSFVDWFLVEELAANQDSGGQLFTSSMKLYKLRDTASVTGKLFMGPLWDFDLSLGNPESLSYGQVGHAHVARHVWFRRLLQDPAFRATVWSRWQTLAANLAGTSPAGESLAAFTERMGRLTSGAQRRDRVVWPRTEEPVSAVTSWLSARTSYLTSVLNTARSLAPVAADDFTRADSSSMGSTPTGSKAWAADSGWAIASNTAAWSGSGDGNLMVDSGLSDDYEVAFTVTALTGTYPIAIIPRASSTSAFGKIYRNQGDNTWNYVDTNSVSESQSVTAGLAAGDRVVCRVEGSVLTLYVNDVLVAQWRGGASSYFPGGTLQGVGGSGGLAATIDAFSVTPV